MRDKNTSGSKHIHCQSGNTLPNKIPKEMDALFLKGDFIQFYHVLFILFYTLFFC
jgi:hypothetical protein